MKKKLPSNKDSKKDPPNIRANSIQRLIYELAISKSGAEDVFKKKVVDRDFMNLCKPDAEKYLEILKDEGTVIYKYFHTKKQVFTDNHGKIHSFKGYRSLQKSQIFPRNGGQESINNFPEVYPRTYASSKCQFARWMFRMSEKDSEERKQACMLFVISDIDTMLSEVSEKDFFDDYMIVFGNIKDDCGSVYVQKKQCNMKLFSEKIQNAKLTAKPIDYYQNKDLTNKIPHSIVAYIIENDKKIPLVNFSFKNERKSFHVSCPLPSLMYVVCENQVVRKQFKKIIPTIRYTETQESIFDPANLNGVIDIIDGSGFDVEVDEETGHVKFVQSDEFRVEEGKKKYRIHLVADRDAALQKEYFKINKPPYICGMCKENITQKYSQAPNGARSMVELHHIAPLASKVHPGYTGLQNVILLCRNCHAACHCFMKQWLHNNDGQLDFINIQQAEKVLKLALKSICNIEVTVEVEAL
jgi:hypothetical protein